MNTTLEELLDDLHPDERAKVDSLANTLIAEELTLRKLGRTRQETLAALARDRKLASADLAPLEEAAELYLSALRRSVEAMGGTLSITATFPGLPPSDVSSLLSPQQDTLSPPA